jgi:large subunit ribosomal protein L30e
MIPKDTIDTIQAAIKNKKAIIGYRQSVRFIKLNTPKMIVISKNIPEKYRKGLDYSAKIAKIKLEIFDGSSKELGIICGFPHTVSTVVIKS